MYICMIYMCFYHDICMDMHICMYICSYESHMCFSGKQLIHMDNWIFFV